MQRVDHHHQAGLFGRSIDLAQPRIAERDTIDMGANLDATQAERTDFLQPLGRKRRILPIGTMPMPIKCPGCALHSSAIPSLT